MISLRVDTLVLANLVQRPTRTLASMGGVALGVVLIVVTAGLAEGMLRSRGERESNIGAEILFQASGSFGVGVETAPLTLPVAYAAALSKIPGVTGATPVGRFIRRGSRGFGFELIEGIVVAPNGEHATYFDVARLRLVQGHLPTRKYQIIIDRVRAEDPTVGIGAKLNLLGRDFEVVGIYEPEVGARVKMPLDTMQDLLGNKDRCSWILVKCASAGIQRSVAARIESRFPGNQIIFTRDIPGLLSRGLPILNVFLNTVIGLATVISSLVILLAMYTAVTERTREIGILKSLGASKRFVATMVGEEALLIAGAGIAFGIALSFLARAGITHATTLPMQIDLRWVLIAASIGLTASLTGAIYPAFHAASQDPVKALAHE